MEILHLFSLAGLAVFALVTGVWLASLYLQNAAIIDIFWGLGFVMLSWIYFLGTQEGYLPRKLLICGMTLVWGLRLSFYIFRRNRNRPEDYRYRAWRAAADTDWWWQSYFKVFLLQGLLMWIISTPLLVAQAAATPARLTWLDFAGLGLWVLGFTFEALADWQLQRFKAAPANQGHVLRQGLWRYTRHPNYFGDAVQWWAFFLPAASTGAYWAIFSPAIMTFLLRRVSGVTLLEKNLVHTKPEYQEYIRTTNAFFPWRPHH